MNYRKINTNFLLRFFRVPSCIDDPMLRFRMRVLIILAIMIFFLVIPALGFHFFMFPDECIGLKLSIMTVLFLWSAEVLFIKKIPYSASVLLGFMLLYAEGLISLYLSGTEFFGPILIFLAPLIAPIMLNFRFSILILFFNAMIFVVISLLDSRGVFVFEKPVIYGINFMIINIFCSLAIEMIMTGLKKSFAREKNALDALELESLSLLKTNIRLEGVIEEKERAEDELRKNVEKFKTMIEMSYEAILIVDSEGYVEYASQSVERLFGVKPDYLKGKLSYDFIHREDKDRVIRKIKRAVESNEETVSLSYKNSHVDGTWLYLETTGSNLLNNPLIKGIVFNIRDVTDYREVEKKVKYYEFYDPLTKLPNRDFFLARLEKEIAKSEKRKHFFAVLCVGVDRIKEINDIYGPSTCDVVIQVISSKLKETYREEDLVSRFMRDEFMVLLSNISNYDSALEIIQKTFSVFSEPVSLGAEEMRITTSIGVCLYPNDGRTSEALVKNSESVMHMAKDNGRNTYHLFDASLHRDLVHRMELEKDIRKAIENDEFEIHYQPKVDCFGKPFGMEALVRWQSPTRGFVSPAEFINVSEKNGMIIDIGYIVLRKACRQMHEWRKKGLDFLLLSVNLSPYQFKDPDLVMKIEEIVRESALDPEWIELEITETGIMENETYCLKRLSELKSMGFMISIDDFGTGYSSLSKLKHYPVNTLKIDKSFVDDLPWDSMSVNIVNTIINLADNLGFNIIAEGVENKEQVDYLVAANCEFFQGYYFSKPLSPSQFEKYIALITEEITSK